MAERLIYHGHEIELTPSGEWFTVCLPLKGELWEWLHTYKSDTLSGACETIQMWERGGLPVQHGVRPAPRWLEMYTDEADTIDYEQVLEDEADEEEDE